MEHSHYFMLTFAQTRTWDFVSTRTRDDSVSRDNF